MAQYIPTTLADLFEYSVREHADKLFTGLADASPCYTYAQFGEKTREISQLMASHGIGTQDKVVILSENMPNYPVVMFAITAFGRVMVPVLPDCSENEVSNILAHSEAKAAFVSASQLSKITQEQIDRLSLVVNMTSLEVIKGEQTAEMATVSAPAPDDMAAVLYTSGTSGNAKGVMLSHRNLCHNLVGIPDLFVCGPGFRFLSILPIAHTYEMSIGLLFPMATGGTVYYLGKTPTPSALIAALAKVRPNGMCSVPLVIEKIYRKSVLKTIVKSDNGKLVAIVKMVDGFVDWNRSDDLGKLMETLRVRTNRLVNKASQIAEVRFIREPFNKTATQKIRRFLY